MCGHTIIDNLLNGEENRTRKKDERMERVQGIHYL